MKVRLNSIWELWLEVLPRILIIILLLYSTGQILTEQGFEATIWTQTIGILLIMWCIKPIIKIENE